VRNNRTVILACIFAAAGLVGCARLGDKVLVFGSGTKVALDLSTGSTTMQPGITLGYSRHEAVWMPLISDAGSSLTHSCLTKEGDKLVCTDTVPATHKCAVSSVGTPPNAIFNQTSMICLPSETLTTKFVGKAGSEVEDAYSVMASFGLKSGGNDQEIAQYLATGIAARELAKSGGAGLVNTEVSPPASESLLKIQAQEQSNIDLIVSYCTNDDGKVAKLKFNGLIEAAEGMEPGRKRHLKNEAENLSPNELRILLSESRYSPFLEQISEAIPE